MTDTVRPPDGSEAKRPQSLSRSSTARFLADGGGLLLGAVAATFTARWLGPSTKGTLAALMFLAGLLAQTCLLGLPDAAMVRVGRGDADTQQALSSTLGSTILASLAGVVVLVTYAWLQLPMEDSFVRDAVIVACASLPLSVAASTLLIVLNIQDRVVSSSAIFFVMTVTTAVMTVLFVGPFDLSVLGGALGTLLGAGAGVAIGGTLLRRSGLHLRPRIDWSYVRPALRFGLQVQLSYVLTVAVARLDLLLLYSIAGQAEAGIYSVALTFGTLSGTVGAALSYAAFPRLSQLGEDDAQALTARLVRAGLAAALVVAIALTAVLPMFIRVVLGRAYEPATVPAILLLLGSVIWTAQWVLARAYAARGDPSLMFTSFLANLVAMLVLDVALIPHWGSTGAAVASVAGPCVGLTVCLVRHRRQSGRPLGELVPRLEDARLLGSFLLRPLLGRPGV